MAGELLHPTVGRHSFSSLFPSPVDPVPTFCCFSFTKRPIPLNLLKSFEYTSGRCNLAAVVFLTKKDVKICADPSEAWVQDRIRALSPP
uniref:C-C motif chemokine n=1 Tax=Naja naja TaxID=35670 RepID=A0A8C6V4A1_NAJNA